MLTVKIFEINTCIRYAHDQNIWNQHLHQVRLYSKDLKSALASGTLMVKRFEINTYTRYAYIQDLKSTLTPGTLIFKIWNQHLHHQVRSWSKYSTTKLASGTLIFKRFLRSALPSGTLMVKIFEINTCIRYAHGQKIWNPNKSVDLHHLPYYHILTLVWSTTEKG